MSSVQLAVDSEGPVVTTWWRPLLSLINFVLLGFCAKSCFGWDQHTTAKLRRATFNILLPIYVFRNMWTAHIDSSIYSIAQYSLAIHLCQCLFWWILFKSVGDSCMRGWLMMVSQGCLTSFFYTNMVNHLEFGQRAVAICLLWDIGGNTPCAQGLLWGIAAYFAPSGSTTGSTRSMHTAFSSPLLPVSEAELRAYRLSVGKPSQKSDSFENMVSAQQQPLVSSRREFDEWTDISRDDKSWVDIIKAVVYQPILPAFALGLTLNLNNFGCPAGADYAMECVGLLFKPFLYFLIGLYSEVITDYLQLRIVATVLGLRYLFAGFFAVMLWLWLPFDSLERTTMALSLLSPVSTMSMYLVAEYNYPPEYLTMSATLTTISVFISFAIQEVVMQSY